MHRRCLPALALALAARPALAAEIRVLSAGAVEPGLEAAVAGFRAATGQAVRIAYATAPRLRERILAGEAPDLLVAPAALLEDLAPRLAGPAVPIGRVGVGIAVRPNAPAPAIRDEASLREAVRQADAVVFNRASTGLYMERLFERLGLAAEVAPKAKRYATGAEVMEHLLHGTGREIGFGAITEIRLVPALHFLGPLPPGLQNTTAYGAAALPGSGGADLLRWLGGPEARRAFDAAGVEG
ncbi:substrate-binding domain-containing protein [Paracraurococcus lichenis]|uniref:Substrate-binding domain-containing protein n=1 Tax=Paracraurococcus lichenis TaxID=3064888 RepID=A0ABT9DSG4_9PROT|nr:substrate-binding domain-containing protein [Paracraurococcus sp. LOR1-02]MDO9706837.1 substrate-binding domain-containing protein [Paracraurococcus sp. LOR1-02]